MRHVILVVLLVGSLAIAPVALGDDGGGFLSIREWVVEVWNSLVASLAPSGDHGPLIEPGGTEHGPVIEPSGSTQDPGSLDNCPYSEPGGLEHGPLIEPSGST